MNGSGFDWLNIPSSNKNGSTTPAPPPVSFGSSSDLPTTDKSNYFFTNSLADHLPKSNSFTYQSIDNNIDDNKASIEKSKSSGDPYNATSDDDLSIPLSLTAQELTLEESKTYMRWYSDILARTNSRTISMNDVYQFLNNFKIPSITKDKLNKVFHKILQSINIGEFFALLRLVSHTLNGLEPKRKLIKMKAPVPTPPSILSKKRQNDDNDDDYDNDNQTNNDINKSSPQFTINSENQENKQLDLDSFTQFMLTGQRPDDSNKSKKKSKKLKSVKFSDQVVTDIHTTATSPTPSPDPNSLQLDYSLPMDQLLNRISQPNSNNLRIPLSHNMSAARVASPDEEEREVLKDMESQINHFQNLNSVDTASIDGVPSNIHLQNTGGNNAPHLKPNMTGPAQMSQMFSLSPTAEEQNQSYFMSQNQNQNQHLQPNMTGPAQISNYFQQNNNEPNSIVNNRINNESPLRPNATGPIDMARLFAPTTPEEAQSHLQQQPMVSLLAFTNQMTGNTANNTLQNSKVTHNGSPSRSPINSQFELQNRPLPPPPVPTLRRNRSVSSPTPRTSSPLSNNNLSISKNAPSIPPRSPLNNNYTNNNITSSPVTSSSPVANERSNQVPPPPPPSRRRGTLGNSAPPLPPKLSFDNNEQFTSTPQELSQIQGHLSNPYSNSNNNSSNGSTANILDDLKALQEEVDKIRDMTGGF